MRLRHLFVLVTVLAFAPAAGQQALPPGVIQQGSVISMQPIPDQAQGDEEGPAEPRTTATHVLTPADRDIFQKAFAAADRSDWEAAKRFASEGHDAMARQLIQWRMYLDKNSQAPFAEIDVFLKEHPQWPWRETLTARAEEAMDPTMAPSAVLAWFAGRDPISAAGKIRLGEALLAKGEIDRGRDLIREGWIDGSFDPAQELAIVQKDGAVLTPDVDKRRLDSLIWREDIPSAKRELARVGDAAPEARLRAQRLAGRSRSEQPSSRRCRARCCPIPACNTIGRAPCAIRATMPVPKRCCCMPRLGEMTRIQPTRVWSELNLDARQALQDGHAKTAYGLVSEPASPPARNSRKPNSSAGWIALRFLHLPEAALAHFKKLEHGVTRPISLARAQYWEGRVYEALGDTASAYQAYSAAAKASGTYYGMIAATRIDADPALHVAGTQIGPLPVRATFDKDDLVRGMRVLADLGEEDDLRRFALYYRNFIPTPNTSSCSARRWPRWIIATSPCASPRPRAIPVSCCCPMPIR